MLFQKIINTEPAVLISLYQDEKEELTLRISCWEKSDDEFYFHEEVIEMGSIQIATAVIEDFSDKSAEEFLKWKIKSS